MEALIELKCGEVIQGLYSWCKDTLGRKFTWIKGAIDMAAGRWALLCTLAQSLTFCLLGQYSLTRISMGSNLRKKVSSEPVDHRIIHKAGISNLLSVFILLITYLVLNCTSLRIPQEFTQLYVHL